VPLTVHYRSGHQSLLAVSNELFYGGTLTSFPSAHDLHPPRPLPATAEALPARAASPGDHPSDRPGDTSGDGGEAASASRRFGSAAETEESASEAHGLVREMVRAGRMESNAGRKDRVEAAIAEVIHVKKSLMAHVSPFF
jgi:hypothetical protein